MNKLSKCFIFRLWNIFWFTISIKIISYKKITCINKTVKSCRVWSISLNCLKCKVMQFGINNPRKMYVIKENDGMLVLEKEKDLEVLVTLDWKCSAQVEVAVNRASWVLGKLRKTCRYFYLNLWNFTLNKLRGTDKGFRYGVGTKAMEYEERLNKLS